MAEGAIAASHCHTSTRLDAVDSGFALGFDTTAPTGAVRLGFSGRHQFLCIAGSEPRCFLQNLLKNG